MRYLIDTIIFTQIVIEGNLLPGDVDAILDNYKNIIYVSSESIKEFVHLVQNGKIVPRREIRSLDVFDLIKNTLGFNVKYVSKEHLRTLAQLTV